MSNTFKIYGLPFQQMTGSYAANLLRYEIDNELLQDLAKKFNRSWTAQPPEEYQLWFPPEIAAWCDKVEIKPEFKVTQEYLEVVFDNEHDCVSFQLIWG